MKMNMAMASTRKDTSRIANAGVDTGANMLGVGATAMTTVVKTILRPPAGTHPSCPRCGSRCHPCVLLLSRGTCGPLIVVTEVFSKNTQDAPAVARRRGLRHRPPLDGREETRRARPAGTSREAC